MDDFNMDQALIEDDQWTNESDELPALPEGMKVMGYRILVMPISLPSRIGSILVADQAKKYFDWQNCYGRIVLVGSAYSLNPKFEKAKFDPEDWPQVGDYIAFPPAVKMKGRIKFFETNLIIMTDEQIQINFGPKMPDGFLYFDEETRKRNAAKQAEQNTGRKPKRGFGEMR